MPLKTKIHRPHHKAHKHEKRPKHFLKVYAPYIPLLLIVGSGLFLSVHHELQKPDGSVKSYSTDVSDSGLLEASNSMRANEDLQPLALNGALDRAAQAKAEDMANRNYWSHNTPDGRKPWDFISKNDYNYRKAAENLAYGFGTSKETVAGWMNSKGHRANVLDAGLKDVGFGVVNIPDYQGKGAETLIVAIYAQPTLLGESGMALARATQNDSSASGPKNISYLQSLTAGKAPWSSFAAGIAIGAIIMYLAVKHARSIRRTLRQGETFVVRHPLFDITLVAFAALATIACQTIGIIY